MIFKSFQNILQYFHQLQKTLLVPMKICEIKKNPYHSVCSADIKLSISNKIFYLFISCTCNTSHKLDNVKYEKFTSQTSI